MDTLPKVSSNSRGLSGFKVSVKAIRNPKTEKENRGTTGNDDVTGPESVVGKFLLAPWAGQFDALACMTEYARARPTPVDQLSTHNHRPRLGLAEQHRKREP